MITLLIIIIIFISSLLIPTLQKDNVLGFLRKYVQPVPIYMPDPSVAN